MAGLRLEVHHAGLLQKSSTSVLPVLSCCCMEHKPMQSRHSGKWVVPAVDPSWLLTCRAASCQARCSGGPVHSCSLSNHPPLLQQLHQKIPQQKKLHSQTPVQSRQHLGQNATHGFYVDQKQRLDEDQYLLFLSSKQRQQLQTNNEALTL